MSYICPPTISIKIKPLVGIMKEAPDLIKGPGNVQWHTTVFTAYNGVRRNIGAFYQDLQAEINRNSTYYSNSLPRLEVMESQSS